MCIISTRFLDNPIFVSCVCLVSASSFALSSPPPPFLPSPSSVPPHPLHGIVLSLPSPPTPPLALQVYTTHTYVRTHARPPPPNFLPPPLSTKKGDTKDKVAVMPSRRSVRSPVLTQRPTARPVVTTASPQRRVTTTAPPSSKPAEQHLVDQRYRLWEQHGPVKTYVEPPPRVATVVHEEVRRGPPKGSTKSAPARPLVVEPARTYEVFPKRGMRWHEEVEPGVFEVRPPPLPAARSTVSSQYIRTVAINSLTND